MCICATEIKMHTYAGRVRASLALDARERTRRPCYNAFTSLSQRTPVLNHLMYVDWTKLSMYMSANGPSACYVQEQSQTISPTWPSPVRSCLAHAASWWQRSPCNAILNTNLQERLVTLRDWKQSVRQLENGILTSKHAHNKQKDNLLAWCRRVCSGAT